MTQCDYINGCIGTEGIKYIVCTYHPSISPRHKIYSVCLNCQKAYFLPHAVWHETREAAELKLLEILI